MNETLPAILALRQSVATPQTLVVRQAMADAIIAVAVKAKEWPALHAAVDIKIEDQREYLNWWENNVRRRGGDSGNRSDRDRLLASDAARMAEISVPQVARWRKWLDDSVAYHDRLVMAACRKAGIMPDTHHRALGTGDNEWFSPPDLVEAARDVLGEIDLDPASHPIPQEWIRASTYFTTTDDGLAQEWHGRVWCNPPYSRDLIGQFADKLLTEFAAGHVTQALLLVHSYSDARWFQALARAATAICFLQSRVRFLDINGQAANPVQGQCLLFYNQRGTYARFAERFLPLGFVVVPI